MSGVAVAAFDRVLELSLAVRADMDEGLARYGLTPARTHLLWVLHQHGPMTQRDLAAALDVSPRNVTGLVDGVESSGFAERRPHPHDRRAVLVALTRRGSRVMARMAEQREQLADALFGGLPPARARRLVEDLDGVIERFREIAAEQGRDG